MWTTPRGGFHELPPSSPSDLNRAGMTTTFFSSPSSHTQIRRVLLRVRGGPDAGMEIQVSRPKIMVGRSGVNDLVLTDTSVSGTHMQIVLNERGVIVQDLESTNGTVIGSLRIREAWIDPGTVISVGKSDIEFLSADEVEIPLYKEEYYAGLYGASPAMREVFAVLERVAKTDMSVLVGGETGTGKELVARALHDESSRASGPFVVLDCGALSRELAEASILGHKKGSFTGAIADRPGAFEEANGGTLFLDEIGELPLDLQPKLLRVLDRREVQRVGESQTRPVDVRVVAATHRDLRKMVGDGQFREDLYFRLSVMNVELPSLRERGDDVLLIADRFREEFSRARNERMSFGEDVVATLRKNEWPGNVRQLRNTVERACYLATNGVISPADLHIGGRAVAPVQGAKVASGELPEQLFSKPFKIAKQKVIDEFERAYLERLMARTDGNLSRAAGEAEITRYYLRELLKRLGMHKSNKPPAGEG